MRTDGVHCQESAGTGPVNLKVVPNGCCLGRSPWDRLIFASLSHTHYWYEVGMLKVPAVYYIINLFNNYVLHCFLNKNLNAPRPSEHPPVRGEKCQNV